MNLLKYFKPKSVTKVAEHSTENYHLTEEEIELLMFASTHMSELEDRCDKTRRGLYINGLEGAFLRFRYANICLFECEYETAFPKRAVTVKRFRKHQDNLASDDPTLFFDMIRELKVEEDEKEERKRQCKLKAAQGYNDALRTQGRVRQLPSA